MFLFNRIHTRQAQKVSFFDSIIERLTCFEDKNERRDDFILRQDSPQAYLSIGHGYVARWVPDMEEFLALIIYKRG